MKENMHFTVTLLAVHRDFTMPLISCILTHEFAITAHDNETKDALSLPCVMTQNKCVDTFNEIELKVNVKARRFI